MNDHAWFEQIPTFVLALITTAVFALSVQAGAALGRRRKSAMGIDAPRLEGIGAVVGALFGLLGFMLAFTFGMAASRREARRDLLLDEVNSIGTTYLRAGLLPPPHDIEVRDLLRNYVDLRLDAAQHPERIAADLGEAEKLQQRLWKHAESLADTDLKNDDIIALFIDSLNQTIDLQTKRATVGNYRIPLVVWLAFVTLMVLAAMSLGYHFGVNTTEQNWLMTLMLAGSFAVVVFLICDLDRGTQGWLKLSHQPMVELRTQMTP